MRSLAAYRRIGRRHMMTLLAGLALCLQVIAPLSPMHGARINSMAALEAALAQLCRPDDTSPANRTAPVQQGHDCQVCITQAVSGLGLLPLALALVVPGRHGYSDWHQQPLTAPDLIHVVDVQPRGPPSARAIVPGNVADTPDSVTL